MAPADGIRDPQGTCSSCTVVTIIGKQCWSQAVLESGSWGHSVLQTPALVFCTFLIEIISLSVVYLLKYFTLSLTLSLPLLRIFWEHSSVSPILLLK